MVRCMSVRAHDGLGGLAVVCEVSSSAAGMTPPCVRTYRRGGGEGGGASTPAVARPPLLRGVFAGGLSSNAVAAAWLPAGMADAAVVRRCLRTRLGGFPPQRRHPGWSSASGTQGVAMAVAPTPPPPPCSLSPLGSFARPCPFVCFSSLGFLGGTTGGRRVRSKCCDDGDNGGGSDSNGGGTRHSGTSSPGLGNEGKCNSGRCAPCGAHQVVLRLLLWCTELHGCAHRRKCPFRGVQ